MKKFIFTAAVAGLIGGAALAQTNVVTSANVVGYVNLTVPANQFTLVANQFITTNAAGVTIFEAFGTSLPDQSQIYAYNGSGYATYTYYAAGLAWYDEAFGEANNVVLNRGNGFWIKNPTATPIEVPVSGNVPGNNIAVTTNTFLEGFTLVSSAYPASQTIASLGLNPQDMDQIYVFNGAGYTTYTYYAAGLSWYDEAFTEANNIVIEVGSGFWYKAAAQRNWQQAIPYNLN